MNFAGVKAFLESWGLHFDTPDGVSNDIPDPQVYNRMRLEARQVGGDELWSFVASIMDATDGRAYLNQDSWEAIEEQWDM